MNTRKTLAPFDLMNPDKTISGFLYPNVDTKPISSFLEIKSGKEWAAGMVVFVGREVSRDDIFSKIVDSGRVIHSVPELLIDLEDYLRQVAKFKIGDVISIRSTEIGFELVKIEKPARSQSKLPQ